MKITSPIEKYTGRSVIGPTAVEFKDGVAEVDELSAGQRAYLEARGYTVEDEAQEDEGLFDPASHNQEQVVEYLERDDIDDEERARVVGAEADGKARKGVREWAEAYVAKREAAAKEAAEREAAEKAKQDGQAGGVDGGDAA
ncbi:hypothetical protein [Ornithinimicrobium sufpigmenti]|uniref:hypothetical protein n=1 Tax=Ornithinimicrobium sufpigmenti TaxID=2508882 RepID=UPI0010361CDF|nr:MULTISPECIES: hypothetical protein [unclassified Ornithinimicrobium]